MSVQVSRRLKPEEEELLRKREELAGIRTTLAERELELTDLRSQLAAFQGRYLRQVGTLYAELDECKAKIAELKARLNPSPAAEDEATEAHEQAQQTFEESHGTASETPEFTASPELKSFYRDVARRIHPDLAKNDADLERRTRSMTEANRAYQAGDEESLRRILREYEDGADAVEGEGTGAELIRLIRNISHAKERIGTIEAELATLAQSEIAVLKKKAEDQEREGGDLLSELAAAVREKIQNAKEEQAELADQEFKQR